MAKVGSLIADLGMNTAKFESGIKKSSTLTSRFTRDAKKQFRKMRRSINTIGGAFSRLGGIIAGIAGPGAMIALTKSSLQAIDANAKLADTFGISIKALAGFELAGERTGATVENVKKSLEKLAVNVADAANGVGDAKNALKDLGLTGQELMKLPLDEQFKLVAERMKGVGSATKRVSIAYDIFGRQGTNMVKMLQLSREELDAFADRAERLGVALSRHDASVVEDANDAFLEATKAVEGFGNRIARAVAPAIKDMSEAFSDAFVQAEGFKKEVEAGVISTARGIGFIQDGLVGIKLVFASIKQGWLEFINFFMSAGVGLVTAGKQIKIALDTAFKVFFEGAKEGWEEVKEYFGIVNLKIQIAFASMITGMKQDLSDFVSSIASALSGTGIKKLGQLSGLFGDMAAGITDGGAAVRKLNKELKDLEASKAARDLATGNRVKAIIDGSIVAMNAAAQETLGSDFGQVAINFSKMTAENREEWRQMIQDTLGTELPSVQMEKIIAKWAALTEQAKGQVDDLGTELKKFWTEMAKDATPEVAKLGSMMSGFFDGFKKGADNMREQFSQNLRKMIAELISSKLLDLMPSLTKGEGFAGFVGKLMGFQHGGSFTVGGGGGTDSNLVAFRATKGETVSVNRAGEQGKGQAVTFNNNYDFSGSTLDEAEVRRMISDSQVITMAQIKNNQARGR